MTKIYWIHQFENSARIGIVARPRGDDWLENEISNLSENKVAILVSLLESDEIHELNLELEQAYCLAKKINYINFPIPDRDIPGQSDKTDNLIELIVTRLNEGLSVAIHCRMGIGRSSIIAAAVLLKYKFKVPEIIEIITKKRGVKVPDTDKQLAWLKLRE